MINFNGMFLRQDPLNIETSIPDKCYKLIPLKKSGSTRGTRLGGARDAVTGFD